MTAESRESPRSTVTTDAQVSGFSTPQERAQLRARSAAAREYAKLAVNEVVPSSEAGSSTVLDLAVGIAIDACSDIAA